MKFTLIIFALSTFFFPILSWGNSSGAPSAGIEELFPGKLLDSDGKEVSKDVLSGKTVGIYFSAHWCPPCRTFTPSLVKFRDKNKKKFEVVALCINFVIKLSVVCLFIPVPGSVGIYK